MNVNLQKRGISLIAAIVILLGMLTIPVLTEGEGNWVYGTEYTGLTVKMTGDTQLKQNNECDIMLELTNNRDETFSFDGAELQFSKKEGLSISGGVGATVTFDSKGDTAKISFKVSASRFADLGSRDYTIVLTKDGETVYQSKYFYLNVSENLAAPDDGSGDYVAAVDILHSLMPETGFSTGDDNSISFQIYNGGNTTIRNAQLKISLPDGIAINNGSNVANLGSISVGKRANADFAIIVEEGLETKNYLITATVTGVDTKNQSVSISKEFYIPLEGTGKKNTDDNTAKPQLMVNDYSYGGSFVQAGTDFSLNLDLLNTSKKDLYNIKVTINSTDGSFVPVDSSNAFYIESIAAGGSYSKAMSLSAKPDAEQKTTAVTVSMSYEDDDGSSYTADDTISIPVTQKTRLVVDDIVPPWEVYMGNVGSASVDFYNMGKTVLSNLRINAEGDFDIMESNSYYAGNMASGANDSYSFTFIPRQVGPMEGKIIFSYEDAAGNAQTIEVPFTFQAMEMPVWDDEGMWEEPVEENKIPLSIIIAGIVLVLLIIGAIIFSRMRKKKRERALQLEDENYEINGKEEVSENVKTEQGAEQGSEEKKE